MLSIDCQRRHVTSSSRDRRVVRYAQLETPGPGAEVLDLQIDERLAAAPRTSRKRRTCPDAASTMRIGLVVDRRGSPTMT
jgi:hypothetical protein